jgi:hypothetical protein
MLLIGYISFLFYSDLPAETVAATEATTVAATVAASSSGKKKRYVFFGSSKQLDLYLDKMA